MVVELLDRPDQAHVALLDQVQEGHAAADVLLGDRDDQAQVGLGQALLGVVRAGLDRLGQVDLVGGSEEADATDLFEIHADRVVQGDRVHHLDLHLHVVVRVFLVLELAGGVGDLDPHLLEGREDAEHLLRLGRLEVREAVEDVVGREVALLLPFDDQDLGLLDQEILEPRLRLFSGLSQPSSPTPVSSTLPELIQLCLQGSDLCGVAAAFGLPEAVDHGQGPTPPRLTLDSSDDLVDDLVADGRGRRRPGTPYEALFLGREPFELLSEPIQPTSLERGHEPQVRCAVAILEVRRIEDTENSFEARSR